MDKTIHRLAEVTCGVAEKTIETQAAQITALSARIAELEAHFDKTDFAEMVHFENEVANLNRWMDKAREILKRGSDGYLL